MICFFAIGRLYYQQGEKSLNRASGGGILNSECHGSSGLSIFIKKDKYFCKI
jgi:hypothetical protein